MRWRRRRCLVLEQNFEAVGPNYKLVGDITFLMTSEVGSSKSSRMKLFCVDHGSIPSRSPKDLIVHSALECLSSDNIELKKRI